MVLEKTLESPLDCKEMQPVDSEGDQPWDFFVESREGTRASKRVEEGLSRSVSGGSGKPSFPSPSAGDLRDGVGPSELGRGAFCPCGLASLTVFSALA